MYEGLRKKAATLCDPVQRLEEFTNQFYVDSSLRPDNGDPSYQDIANKIWWVQHAVKAAGEKQQTASSHSR